VFLIRLFGPATPHVLPFLLFIVLMAGGAMVSDHPQLSQQFDNRWLYAARIALVGTALAMFWRNYRELQKPYNIQSVTMLISIVVGVLVFTLWIQLDVKWLSFSTSEGFVPLAADGTLLWVHVIPRMIGAAILVPVIEELFWRSFLMRWLEKSDFLSVDPRTVKLKALLVSSVVFALEHQLWFAGLLAGLAYGWLYMRTANLWYPIVAHATTNAILGVWVVNTGSWQFW
jgi:uncharacterized protein